MDFSFFAHHACTKGSNDSEPNRAPVILPLRGFLLVHRSGGAGGPLHSGLPPGDPGPTAGGHREPVHRAALLLWSLLTQWQSPRPVHPGKRQQLPPLWQRSFRCRVAWGDFLCPLCPSVCWCGGVCVMLPSGGCDQTLSETGSSSAVIDPNWHPPPLAQATLWSIISVFLLLP